MLLMGLRLRSGSCWDDGTLMEGQIRDSQKPPETPRSVTQQCWEATAPPESRFALHDPCSRWDVTLGLQPWHLPHPCRGTCDRSGDNA